MTTLKGPYGPHRLTFKKVNGGTEYTCSCGWSHGWISGGRRAARRVNRAAHRINKKQFR